MPSSSSADSSRSGTVPAIYPSIGSFLCFSLISRSGDWFYQVVELTSLLAVLINIYLIMGPLKYTHNSHHDTFGQGHFLPKQYTSLFLIVPAIVLALIVRPHRSGTYCDLLWAIAMYLEGVAIYPQLHMFQKNRVRDRERLYDA